MCVARSVGMSMNDLATTPKPSVVRFAHPAEKTAAHRAEVSVHELDERLAVTYEHAGIGIAEIDADGTLLRVNARLCGMMGLSAEQLQGRSIFDETHPADRDRDRAQ